MLKYDLIGYNSHMTTFNHSEYIISAQSSITLLC